MTTPELRLVVLGSGGAGKSCLVIRLITDNYVEEYDPTIEDNYREIREVDGAPVCLDITDTAGQEEFASMKYEHYRNGEAFLIVYSITSRTSFDQAKNYRDKIIQERDREHEKLILVLAATKCDLENQRQVQRSEGQELADEWKCSFFETSAKQKINNVGIFDELVHQHRNQFCDSDDESNNNNKEQIMSSLGKCCMVGCILFVYICLGGCLIHLLYICSKAIYTYCKSKQLCIRCVHEPTYETAMKLGDRSESRNQLRLTFPKVKYIEEDQVNEPVLSLKNFDINRKFSWIRFIKSLFCGIFLAFIVIFQTTAFLFYSETRNLMFYKYIYPENYRYDEIHNSLLLDFLGLVVGRFPDQDPDAVKERNWFLRQTRSQKIQRVIITILLCLTLFIIYYNILQLRNEEELNVSRMESVGPFALFWIIWLLLSCWIAYESKLYPSMPATTRLRSIKLYLGERFNHVTDAHKFLRAYAWTRNRRWKLSFSRTIIIIFLGLLYAAIPYITKSIVSIDDITHESTTEELLVEFGAFLVNVMLILSFVYAIEVQYSKHFDNYREWMHDLTMLLNKTHTNKSKDEHYIPQKGRNFSEDIFLSLTRKANALGWLEIRSFLAAEGKLLFAEQELPTLWILILTILLFGFLLYRVFFIDGNALESILFNGSAILCVICLASLTRIATTGYKFEAIQQMQERLLGEQRFFMRCSKQFNLKSDTSNTDDPINLHGLQYAHGKRMKRIRTNTEDFTGENFKIVNSILNEKQVMGSNSRESKEIELVEFVANQISAAEQTLPTISEPDQEETKLHSNNAELEELQNEIMQPLYDDQEAEMQPLLIDIRTQVKEIHDISDYMNDKTKQSDKFGFIDNMLFIVQRKDIFPRLFNVKLNSVLAKAIAGIFLGVMGACIKLVF